MLNKLLTSITATLRTFRDRTACDPGPVAHPKRGTTMFDPDLQFLNLELVSSHVTRSPTTGRRFRTEVRKSPATGATYRKSFPLPSGL